MFTSFMLKALAAKHLAGVPEEQKAKMLSLIERNPDLFMEIAKDAKSKMDQGMNQTAAVQAAFFAREAELRALSGETTN